MRLLKRLVRESVIAGNSSELRALMLTEAQIELFLLVKSGKLQNSSQVAKHYRVSTQNAFNKLNRLYSAGYIMRRSIEAPSGGFEYVYYVDQED